MFDKESYIAALDVGTTTIRCQIINSSTEIVGSSNSTVKLIYPQPGFYEINPNELWERVLMVIRGAIANANLNAKDIKCLGISTQRSTFTTWRSDTGQPIHNFITWKDMRSKNLCRQLNSSLAIKSFKCAVYALYLLTWNQRYLTGSRLKIAPNHVTGRLLWALENLPELKEAVRNRNVMFGTVDTWLLYKFSNRNLHVTDISNASATAFYDPFVKEWGSWAKIILKIPQEILPEVVENDFDFGTTAPGIFEVQIPIKCVMADQSSSMFASCCFNEDDLKVTLGTGAFLDINTGNHIHTSVTGIYPLIAWKMKNNLVNMGEVACNDCGSLIQWALETGFLQEPSDSYKLSISVQNTDGVYFIPAFSGLGPPINDNKAASGFLGIKPTTTKNHLVRAILESICYRITLAFEILKKERRKDYKSFTIDGGVAKNDFVCQLISDLTGLNIERMISTEMSVLGVAFVAGLQMGVWKNKSELKKLRKIERIFTPSTDQKHLDKCKESSEKWLQAVHRFKSWYDED